MKNLKLLLIAGLLTTALVNTAIADGFKSKIQDNVVKQKFIVMSFEQAIQDPGIVTALYRQHNGGFLGGPGMKSYSLDVTYQKRLYRINGTTKQWEWFFKMQGTIMPREDKGKNNN